jgi:predicted Zn-dependent peptidase
VNNPPIATADVGNGLVLLFERVPSVRSVSMGVWVRVGSRDEPAERAGLTHFVEHLVFKGTERRSALDIAKEIDAVGGDLNAFTTKELTCYYARVLADAAEVGVDLLADITCSPAFEPEHIELERSVVYEELRASIDDSASAAQEYFYSKLFPAHPLGRPIIGSFESLASIERSDLVDHFERRYGVGTMVVAVAGGIEYQRAFELVSEKFQNLRIGEVPARNAPSVARGAAAVQQRTSEEAHVFVAVPGIPAGDPRRYPLMYLNQVLGGSTSSRIFQEIREKRGLAYSAHSFADQYQDVGCFGVYVGTSPNKVKEVLHVVQEELYRIGNEGISEEEFEVAQGHIVGALALSDEDTGSKMSRLARTYLVLGQALSLDEIASRVRRVTRDEVNELAACLLADSAPFVTVVGPFDEREARELVADAGISDFIYEEFQMPHLSETTRERQLA